MPSTCIFEFDRTNAVYYSGEVVNGRVQLITTSEKTVREIYILFKGETKVPWEELKSRDCKEYYVDNETYFNSRAIVFSEGTLPPGTHIYTFSIPLPPQCPTSRVEEYGHIQYEVTLVINRPYRFDNVFTHPITIIRQLDFNLQPQQFYNRMFDENQSTTLFEDKISFRNNDHGHVLCEKMYKYFKEQMFCDIIIKADLSKSDNEIYAHRSVLSSHSEYFSNIFTSGTQMANQTEIVVENISEEMLGKIVEYCYTGRLEVENDKDRVEELLNKAQYFQIKFLKETCIKWLNNHTFLSPLSVYRLNLLEDYSAMQREKIFGDICENFMQICTREEFLKLSADKLAKVIAQDNINVNSEENVLDALLAWLNYNFDERQQHIGKLLPFIRFPFLQPTYISRHLKAICSSNENMKLMLEALEWHNVPESRKTLDWICTKERHIGSLDGLTTKERHIGSLIMIIGNKNAEDAAKFFEVYDPILNKSFHCNILPKEKPYFQNIAATVMDDELIVAGGYEENDTLNEVYKLNLVTMTWSQLPAMLMTRRSFKLIVHQNKIYAVGGEPMTNTMECWDPITNDWKFVSGMSTARSGHAVIELRNKLYALGGCCNFTYLSSVECYDANWDKWTKKASMVNSRYNFTVGILNDFLYAFGGGYSENSVERYDAKADKWILLHTIDMDFVHLKCISLQNYFIGTANFDNATKIVKYDPVTNVITILHQLKLERCSHEVLAIPHIMLSKFQ